LSESLHIVFLTAPSPPDYGGAFDLFYKIPALANLGKKIILHYFDYKEGRGHEGLEPYCVEINKYNRSGFLKSLVRAKPYIVSSRIEAKLIHRLNEDNYPVLLEGIHCTGIIPYLKNRKIIVRVHNDEAEYYRQLQRNEQNVFKTLYFSYESLLLSHYQKKLSKEPTFVFVSEIDKENFEKKYHQKSQAFIPCFLPWQTLHSLTGKGDYCLYHGNLAISENIKAALWLAEKIFSQIDFPFIIAGKNASALKGRLPVNPNLKLIENPSDQELSELITGAHINVLPSFNSTGVKLKLLHALFKGRFCVTNEAGIAGSSLHSGVHIANDKETMVQLLKELLSKKFTEEDIQQRSELTQVYNNDRNAIKLSELL
jgi:hypothetical protein